MGSGFSHFHTFKWNNRGFSFEVQDACKAAGTPVDCSVVFDHHAHVTKFGQFGRKQFPPDPDIAGVGIFTALLCQSFLILCCAIISVFLHLRHEYVQHMERLRANRTNDGVNKHEGEDDKEKRFALFFSVSDISTILSVVYLFDFVAKAKCTMSIYHYYVALNSVLIACSTMVFVFITSRHHFWRTWAGIVRFLIALVLFTLLGIFFGYQRNKYSNSDFPNWKAPHISRTKDSAILLPASCFLDPDLIQRANPYAPKRPTHLTDAQLDRIGRPVKGHTLPQFALYCLLAVVFGMGISAHVGGAIKNYRANKAKKLQQFQQTINQHQEDQMINQNQETPSMHQPSFLCKVLFYSVLFIACFATDVICAVQILSLRDWTQESGWLRDNSENDFFSIGQLLPVFSLFLILLAFLDRIRVSDVLTFLKVFLEKHGLRSGQPAENKSGYNDFDHTGTKDCATVHVNPLYDPDYN